MVIGPFFGAILAGKGQKKYPAGPGAVVGRMRGSGCTSGGPWRVAAATCALPVPACCCRVPPAASLPLPGPASLHCILFFLQRQACVPSCVRAVPFHLLFRSDWDTLPVTPVEPTVGMSLAPSMEAPVRAAVGLWCSGAREGRGGRPPAGAPARPCRWLGPAVKLAVRRCSALPLLRPNALANPCHVPCLPQAKEAGADGSPGVRSRKVTVSGEDVV